MSQIIKKKKTIKRSNPSTKPHSPTINAYIGIKDMPQLGKCLEKIVATEKTKISVKQSIGATEGTIKQRIYNNNISFTKGNYASNTFLSSYIWHLKDMNISPYITWEILKLVLAYKTLRKCIICLQEKKKLPFITYQPQKTLLNKKSEILSKCRHENKHLFSHFDPYT